MRDARSEVIEHMLREELSRAHNDYRAADLRFDSLTNEIPSGIPHLDGALRIQQAGRLSRMGLDRYIFAMRRFADFTLHGTIPQDLRKVSAPPLRNRK